MRSATLVSLLSFAVMSCACAQNAQSTQASAAPETTEGTVACKTEAAMLKIMHTMTPSLRTNKQVMNELISRGDCLIIPDDWNLLQLDDPPLNQQQNHASKWTIRTPNGIVHMWGAPMGGD